MNKFYLFFTLFLFPLFIKSQINKDGLPLVQIYTTDQYEAHGENWAIVRDNKGIMYFANNYGLLQYNGTNWKLFENPYSPYIRSLEVDDKGRVYYGAANDFGMILPDSIGNLKYFSISKASAVDTLGFNNVWNVNIVGNYIYFQAYENIFKYKLPINIKSPDEIKKNMKIFTPKSYFHWSFKVNNNFYVREADKGLYIDKNDSLVFIKGSELFANQKIYVMLPYKDDALLIVTRETGIYIYEPGNKETPFNLMDWDVNETLINSYIYGGVSIAKNLYAIYTLANGIIIFNDQGDIINHYTQNNCLPHATILSINYDDKEGLLWFTSNKEIGNINLASPIRQWLPSTGLQGIVYDVIRFNNYFYAATNNGIYFYDVNNEGYAAFKKIQGLDIRVRDLEIFHGESSDKLLAAAEGAVFEITGEQAKMIDNSGIVQKLKQSQINPNLVYIGYLNGFAYAEYDTENWTLKEKNPYIKNSIIDIYEDNQSEIYLGSEVGGIIKLKNPLDSIIIIDSARGLPIEGSQFKIFNVNNDLIVAAYKGLFKINKETNYAEPYKKLGTEFTMGNYGIFNISEDNEAIWLGAYSNDLSQSKWQGIIKLKKNDSEKFIKEQNPYNILPPKVPYVLFTEKNYLWVANAKGFFKLNKKKEKNYSLKFYTVISKVTTGANDSLLFAGNYTGDSVFYIQSEQEVPVLAFKHNQMTFEYAAGFYEQEEKTQYSYRLLGFNNQWSKWTTEHKFTYTNIHEGDYTFQVRAKNIYQTESEIANYKFTILPPWYRTPWAYISYAVSAFLLIWLIVKYNTKRLKEEKIRLELLVAERTREIKAQHDKIAELHKNIMDSIFYARRIQEALMPPKEFLHELLPEHFVLFKPRDIVSGDFYWATKHDGKAILVAADCTGHGVPGAFMSMLGISFLNEIVNKIEDLEAHKISNELRANVKKSLRQTGKENEAKDGMDIALCIIDYENMQMEYSGAFNSLYLIRKGELIKYDADRMPIGIYIREKESFTKHIVQLQKGDSFYIFSDGFVDQFGGPKGSKLMTKRFKELLLNNYEKSMDEQKKILDDFLTQWQSYTNEKGEKYRQIDDILVIGVRV
ncbi:MAG: SpoIIE family protein phosphatase [Bacteroidales bacterium]|nr:SpoIIE family protein phosphatase [Bacteroidales bacterium]